MSQLVKLLRDAGRSSGRPTAGFGARSQEARRKRIILVAALEGPDLARAKAAAEAGADAVEVSTNKNVNELAAALAVPVGLCLSGALPATFDFRAMDGSGLDYVKVEAGDVPASVFLMEGPAVVLELKEDFSDTMLKMLNFLPAKAVQVDAPDNIEGFTIKQLMEKRVDRELIGKPLLMKVGSRIKPEAAQLLALVSPNGLVVPAADVPAWKVALADIKELSEDDEPSGAISLKAPAA